MIPIIVATVVTILVLALLIFIQKIADNDN